MFAPSFLRLALAVGAAGLTTISSLARADAIYSNFDVAVPGGAVVFNDRIGNSRFFSSPNTDSIRISTFPVPTPDTDLYGVPSGADTLFSLNGAINLTTVSVTHPSLGSFMRPLAFVGQNSTGGGGRNEFTTIFNRANPAIASRLDAFDATPFSITVSNPSAPSVTSLTFSLTVS